MSSWVFPLRLNPLVEKCDKKDAEKTKAQKFCFIDLLSRDRFVVSWARAVSRCRTRARPRWCALVENPPDDAMFSHQDMVEHLSQILHDVHGVDGVSDTWQALVEMRLGMVGTKPFYVLDLKQSACPEIQINQFPVNDLTRVDFQAYPIVLYVTHEKGCVVQPLSEQPDASKARVEMELGPNSKGIYVKYKLRMWLSSDRSMYRPTVLRDKVWQYTRDKKLERQQVDFPESRMVFSIWDLA